MSNAPPTFGTNPELHSGIAWSDPATLHRRDDGAGLLFEFKVLRRGTLATLVRDAMRLPRDMRKHYVIEIPGNHRLDFAEIEGLASRPDYPKDKDEGT